MRKEAWKAWEDDVAEAIGGDLVKASGATDYHKGDVKSRTFLVDAKHTESAGYSVSESFWRELSTWARNEGREPAIAIRVESPDTHEIAVVGEMSYAERHPDFVPDDQLKKQKQKKVTASMAGKKPTSFLVGNYRLVAYSFAEFAKDARDEGE